MAAIIYENLYALKENVTCTITIIYIVSSEHSVFGDLFWLE